MNDNSNHILRALIEHLNDADRQSGEEVVLIVTERFVKAFRDVHASSLARYQDPTTASVEGKEDQGKKDSATAPAASGASGEEIQLDALRLALALYRPDPTPTKTLSEDDALLSHDDAMKSTRSSTGWVDDFLASPSHHPTAALFLQDAIHVAFLQPSEKRRSSREAQHIAIQLCRCIGQRVGRTTARLMLPGVVSACIKYLQTYLPRRDSHTQSRTSIVHTLLVLHTWICVCFGLTPVSPTPNEVVDVMDQGGADHAAYRIMLDADWDNHDAAWAAKVVGHIVPLMMVLLDCTALSDVILSASRSIVAALVLVTRSMLYAAWDRSQCATAIGRSLLHSLILQLTVLGRGPMDNAQTCGRPGWLQAEVLPVDGAASNNSNQQRYDALLSWESLMEHIFPMRFVVGHKHTAMNVAALTTFVSMSLHGGSDSGRKQLRWLLQDDAEVLWNALRRIVRHVASAVHALDGSMDTFHMTSRDRRERQGTSASYPVCTKALMDLLDEFLTVVGHVCVVDDDAQEVLVEHMDNILEDWEAYASHPEWIYAASRIALFGSCGGGVHHVSAVEAVVPPGRVLANFAKQERFEVLWELIAKEHLWQIEIRAEECTFQELQHRSHIACCIMGCIRQTAECLAALLASMNDASSPGTAAGGGNPRVVLERLTLLCMYQIFEKQSSTLQEVRDAAEMTVRTMATLHVSNNPLLFFLDHCRTIMDEASRCMLDPDLHAGAVKVACGMMQFLSKQVSATPAVIQEHGARITAIVGEAVRMMKACIEAWYGQKQRRQAAGGVVLGCLHVILEATQLTCSVTESNPRMYPSEEDWDDNRQWTSTLPDVCQLQETIYHIVMECLHPLCMQPNTAIAARAVDITMRMLAMFRLPSNAQGGGVIVRTHLNTLHRSFHVLLDVLGAQWQQRREDALLLLAHARRLEVQDDVDKPLHAITKRTKRSSLQRDGRWLTALPVPIEFPTVLRALIDLVKLSPQFLLPRTVEEAIPSVLLWYIRVAWLGGVPTTREDAAQKAAIAFATQVASIAEHAGYHDLRAQLLTQCRGAVSRLHWNEPYGVSASNEAPSTTHEQPSTTLPKDDSTSTLSSGYSQTN